MLGAGEYSWQCTLCDSFGHGGAKAFEVHYATKHVPVKPSYTGYLIEARTEHGLKGAAAYQWAHAAWEEFLKNH